MKREDWYPSQYSRICSDHFEETFIRRSAQRIELKENAIPTRFKTFPSYLKSKVTLENYFIYTIFCSQEMEV